MKLSNAAGAKAHIHAGNGRRDLKVVLGDLPRPSAVLDALGNKIERSPKLRHAVDVGCRRVQESWLVAGKVWVLRPRIS
jgi:hypothetical protein